MHVVLGLQGFRVLPKDNDVSLFKQNLQTDQPWQKISNFLRLLLETCASFNVFEKLLLYSL